MNTKTIAILAITFLAGAVMARPAHARGCAGAGGYHGGGMSSGYHGGGNTSGYHGTGNESGYHGAGNESGYHGGANYSGYHNDSFSGYHPDSYAGYHPYASAGGASVSLPTDGGFAAHPVATGQLAGGQFAGSASSFAASHNVTQSLNGSHVAAQGAAVRNAYNGAGSFDHGWYGDHPGAWAAAGWDRGAAWGGATWGSACDWLGWGSALQPIYYDYGNNITYQGDQVYYGDNAVASADQYYQQASTLAQSVPPPDATNADWTPLGVFALVQNDQDSPQFVVQFAVNKSGAIAGNYVDLVSDSVQPIHGAVSPKTQRVAWIVGNNKKNVGETGMENLMRDEAPALIHRGADQTQQWLLVRLKSPPPKTAAP